MQQGHAFYQRLLLLRVLEIFNSGVFHIRTVFYSPHHSHTSIQWNKIRNNHQTVLTGQNRGKSVSTRRDDRVDIKNAKNGAKTRKMRRKQDWKDLYAINYRF
jgi:hypothetical protein